MKVEVVLWPEVHEDFRALPSDKLRLMAMKHLICLEQRHDYGLRLKDHPVWGDLSDCWKIYLDESHDADPRWRIIYTLKPDSEAPTTAEVVIIGPRADATVYREVMRRLDRPLGPNHPEYSRN